MKQAMLSVLVLVAATGCGGGGESYDFAPVSGTVTLDGDPLSNATVTFQPTGKDAKTGPGSYGKTDAQGKYTLKVTTTGDKGAVVGKHRVLITRDIEEDENDAGSTVPPKDQLPKKYNRETTLEFDVPPDGSESADFQLES